MRLFLSGVPGIGKTTIIRDVVKRLRGIKCAGFYTEETRKAGQRTGFQIITLDGGKATLASVSGKRAGPRVGRYKVHIEEFDGLVLSLLEPETTPADLYVVDEIGKMELLSPKFIRKLTDLMSQPAHVFGTIAKKGEGLIQKIKAREDVELVEVTAQNRDRLTLQLAERILNEIAGAVPKKSIE
ncbi:MAG: NTPase [Deltaproteobacteria bacterium]|nr:NTPase [Deltaproteobacteria bacterium]